MGEVGRWEMSGDRTRLIENTELKTFLQNLNSSKHFMVKSRDLLLTPFSSTPLWLLSFSFLHILHGRRYGWQQLLNPSYSSVTRNKWKLSLPVELTNFSGKNSGWLGFVMCHRNIWQGSKVTQHPLWPRNVIIRFYTHQKSMVGVGKSSSLREQEHYFVQTKQAASITRGAPM